MRLLTSKGEKEHALIRGIGHAVKCKIVRASDKMAHQALIPGNRVQFAQHGEAKFEQAQMKVKFSQETRTITYLVIQQVAGT